VKSLTTDVVVVGAGAAGLVAALAARRAGLEAIIVESTSLVGGATATDTGHLWLPANHLAGRGSRGDSPSDAVAYLDAICGPVTAASTRVRRDAFATTAPVLARWLAAQGVRLAPVRGRPDTHPSQPGARTHGRVLASVPFDLRDAGPLGSMVRTSGYGLQMAPRTPRGLATAVQALARGAWTPTRTRVEGGSGLVAQLLMAATQAGATLWLDSPMTELLPGEGRVRGIRLEREGGEVELLANTGVVLACGGFEASQDLRDEHLPLPTNAVWSTGWEGNLGEGIAAAQHLGAPVASMDDAWWTLVALFDGVTYRMTAERSLPFGLVVDSAGARFVNESGPMPEIGRHVYDHHRGVRSIPAWLVIDDRHRRRYRLGPWLPGSAPRRDAVTRARSLSDLAAEIGVDTAGLIGTVVRFNTLAKKGKDADFGRGASAADRANGDPTHRRNPCLGPIERSPFWAVPLYPGDTGTKGGLVVDGEARVLGPDGLPLLEGLHATSGTAASLFGTTGPGSGAALASACVDALRAVAALAGRLDGLEDPSGPTGL